MTNTLTVEAQSAEIAVDHNELTRLHEQFKTLVRWQRAHAMGAQTWPTAVLTVAGKPWTVEVVKEETDKWSLSLLLSGNNNQDRLYVLATCEHTGWSDSTLVHREPVWRCSPKVIITQDDQNWNTPERRQDVLLELSR
ncbi:MAG: hypothetical protein WC498_01235 [Candidatus Saccharimonadales bacterium]